MADAFGNMYAISITMTLLVIIAIVLRLFARSRDQAGWSWDDVMILPATLFATVIAICLFVGTARGYIGHYPKTRSPGPGSTRPSQSSEKVAFAVLLCQILSVGFIKATVLLFYQRTFSGQIFRTAVWMMVTLGVCWTVGFFVAVLRQCVPISALWVETNDASAACIDTNNLFIALGWSDVLVNVVILLLPIIKVYELDVPIKQRVGVCIAFLVGALTVAAGIAQLSTYYRVFDALNSLNNAEDATHFKTPLLFLSLVESALGITAACLPTFSLLFFPPNTGATTTTTTTTTTNNNNNHTSRRDLKSAISRPSYTDNAFPSRWPGDKAVNREWGIRAFSPPPARHDERRRRSRLRGLKRERGAKEERWKEKALPSLPKEVWGAEDAESGKLSMVVHRGTVYYF